MKRIIIIVCWLAFIQLSKAQGTITDSAKNELLRINKVFDSSQYLGFDVNIAYRSDSASTTVATDAMTGSYVLNKKNLYYNMGGTEYVQTDSFSYTIYKDEKMMIMTKNFVPQNSNVFPLRNFVDSVMQHYGSTYHVSIDTVAIDTTDYFKRIKFTKDSSSFTNDVIGLYNYFYIDYQPGSYLPVKFEFSYNEYGGEDDSIPISALTPILLTKTITMNFSNYKAYTATEIFDDFQYILYNRQRKIYEPADKYKDYRFIISGFDNEDPEAQYYRQVPYDNGGNNL